MRDDARDWLNVKKKKRNITHKNTILTEFSQRYGIRFTIEEKQNGEKKGERKRKSETIQSIT